MLRTSSLKLHVLPVYHFLWSAVRLFDYFLEESVKRQAHYFLDSFESPCSTRKTRNPTRSSMLDPREDQGSRIESRSSTRKRLSTYTCPVLYSKSITLILWHSSIVAVFHNPSLKTSFGSTQEDFDFFTAKAEVWHFWKYRHVFE